MVSTLLRRGRLPFPQLVRYSNLKPRTVRAAILVLVQHNILWHATSEDGGEVFEVNVDDCLARLRFGRYVWLAEQCFGTLVCPIELMFQVTNKPHCRVPALCSSFLTMENFARQASCRVWLPKARRVRPPPPSATRLLILHVQNPLPALKPCMGSLPHPISNRQLFCHISLRKTSGFCMRLRRRRRLAVFRQPKSFAKLAKLR